MAIEYEEHHGLFCGKLSKFPAEPSLPLQGTSSTANGTRRCCLG